MRLADVAAKAGVSTATVSRVLNHPESVRGPLRERVTAVVRELNYVPDGAARALASRRSYTMGAVIPTIDNAIFARSVLALQSRLAEHDYTLLIASTDYDGRRELGEANALIRRGVDGLMLVGMAHEQALYDLLARAGVPYVNTWMYRHDAEHPCIGFNNEAAGKRLASYLVDLGHRRIAMIAGVTEFNDRAAARVAGVRAALTERGLELQRLLESRYDYAEARRALRRLLAAAEPPTAVICGNDVIALGALFEAQANGVAVPARLSLTGFDDFDLAAQVDPGLTTMRVPAAEMGAAAAEYLLARLAGRPAVDAVDMEASLIVRGTTAPPAA